jgi:hypothetical protein
MGSAARHFPTGDVPDWNPRHPGAEPVLAARTRSA